MGWGEYARSKMPLKLVIILISAIAANLMLIEGVTLLLAYDHSGPIDTDALTGMNRSYENATVLDTFRQENENDPPWYNSFTGCLLQTSQGEHKLAVVEHHFLFDRSRYREDLSCDADLDLPMLSATGKGQALTCGITNSSIEWLYVSRGSNSGLPLILVPLLIVEYLAFVWFFKRDEIL